MSSATTIIFMLSFQKTGDCKDSMTSLSWIIPSILLPRAAILGIHSMYFGIGIASQSNGFLGVFHLFQNRVNRTHP